MSEILHSAKAAERSSTLPDSEQSPKPPSTTERTGGPLQLLGRLGRMIPSLLVLAALGGLAYWGHMNDWTIPKFSSLSGNGSGAGDDWCNEHGVPESQCVECKPDLFPKHQEYGWCKKHGIANCPFEHPDVAQLSTKPQITQGDLDRAQRALDFTERPENNSKCKLHQRRIQFASKEAVEKAGIDVTTVWEAPMVEGLTANGEITYDLTRVARLSARVPGSAWWAGKQVGDRVGAGDLLALVDSADVGKAKAEFLQAVVGLDLKARTLEGIKGGGAVGAVSERLLRESDAAVREAEIRLTTAEQALVNLGLPIRAGDLKGLAAEEMRRRVQFLGLPEPVTRSLDPNKTTTNLLPLASPIDGVVVSREVVAGEVVDTAKVLFVVADIRQMWLSLNLRQEDATKLALGQPVRFRADGIADQIHGKITWISTSVDEKTRTVKVRGDLANPHGDLRANTFGRGQVILRDEKNAIVVPNDAVHSEGDCFVVFVRDKNFLKDGSPKVFHVRQVRIGAKDGQNTEIIAGLLPGELVAAKGSGTLRSELLKNNLGEG